MTWLRSQARGQGRGRVRAERVRQVARRVRWYVREFTGESAYERYVAHATAGDPAGQVMTRRAFERSRTDAREADPREGFRCC